MRRLPVFAALTGLLTIAAIVGPLASAHASPQRDAVKQLNQIRRAHGLTALRPAPALKRSSARYARHMLARGWFGHASRIAVASRFGRAGEALAQLAGSRARPGRAVASWMASPTHRALLLSPRFRWIGMGIARGHSGSEPVTVWVAHVGAP